MCGLVCISVIIYLNLGAIYAKGVFSTVWQATGIYHVFLWSTWLDILMYMYIWALFYHLFKLYSEQAADISCSSFGLHWYASL